MFRIQHTAGQHTRRAGDICWQHSINLSRRDQSTQPWLAQRLSQSIFTPDKTGAQNDNSKHVNNIPNIVDDTKHSEGNSDSKKITVEGCGRPAARRLDRVNSVPKNDNASPLVARSHHSHLPPTTIIARNGQYTKLRRQPSLNAHDKAKPVSTAQISSDKISQLSQMQHNPATAIPSNQSRVRALKIRRIEARRGGIVVTRNMPHGASGPALSSYTTIRSVSTGRCSPMMTLHTSSSPIRYNPLSSRMRSFSTLIRLSQSSATITSKDVSSTKSTLNSSFSADPPIRAKLKAFQHALDNSSEEKKIALGIAFNKLSFGLDFPGREDEQDNDPDDDYHDKTLDEHVVTLRGILEPGDLIEIPTENDVCLGLVTATFAGANIHVKRQIQVLLSTGPWIHRYDTIAAGPWFVVKKFADASEYAKLKEYLPDKALPVTMLNRKDSNDCFVPVEVSAPITEKMQAFQRAADKIYRSQASRIDSAFELIAQPNDPTYMTLDEITRIVLKKDKSAKISREELYAVHKACSLYNPGFLEDLMHWQSQTFEILSKRDAALITQIKRWVRDHNEHNVSLLYGIRNSHNQSILEIFANEVRPIIAKSRKHRKLYMDLYLGLSKDQPTTTMDGISYQIIPGTNISPSTSLILKFLELWAGRMGNGMTARSLTVLGAAIIKSTKLYDFGEKVNGSVALTLLKECGVISPWKQTEDIGGRLSDPLQGDNKQTKELLLGSSEEYAQNIFKHDSMAELRHDWGDMPVFCIDSAGTVEVDDGISLEATSTPGTYWIHTHIANPSAFISPDSKTVELAQQQYSSVYLPDRINRMIPVSGLVAEFSLGKGRPVLTISTKLDMDGVVLDRQVRSGFINNVLRLTPQTLYQHLGQQFTREESKTNVYIVGRPSNVDGEHKHVENRLSEQAVETLHRIQQLVTAWSKRNDASWNRKWRYTMWKALPEFRVHHAKYESSDFTKFRRFVGDPTIAVKTSTWEPHQSRLVSPKEDTSEIVSKCMILSGYTAAMWCSERGVPAVFRGSKYNTSTNLNALAAIATQKAPTLREDILQAVQYRNMEFETKAFSSTRPVKHEILPLEAYMQVTSPLRRFDDLLNHWQIEVALRTEAKLGRPPTAFDVVDYPHSEDKIKQLIERKSVVMRKNIVRVRNADSHWLRQFLVRGSLLGECRDLPELLTMYIVHTEEAFKVGGVIAELSHYMTNDSEPFVAVTSKEPEVGEVWKIRLSRDMIDSNSPTKLRIVPVERVA